MKESFCLTGIVVRGNQLGRTIGFPTANIDPGKNTTLEIKNGVYAARIKIKDKVFNGMANIGVRPTLDQHKLTFEVHIFDFSEELYGQTISVYLHDFIREEKRFSGLDELKNQLHRDESEVRRILSGWMQPDTQAQ
jgi:riboflavin kinase/FMN adenylyltransferase